MAKSNKPLTLSVLKKLDSALNTTKQVTLSTQNTLEIDLHFRNSVIEEVFNKLVEINKIIQEEESLKDFQLDKYAMLLLILNFTSLKNIQAKNTAEELQIMNKLIDLDLFKEIVKHIENEVPNELKKFNEKMFEIMQSKLDFLEQQQKFMEVLNEEMEKVKEKQIEIEENKVDEGTEEVEEVKTNEIVN